MIKYEPTASWFFRVLSFQAFSHPLSQLSLIRGQHRHPAKGSGGLYTLLEHMVRPECFSRSSQMRWSPLPQTGGVKVGRESNKADSLRCSYMGSVCSQTMGVEGKLVIVLENHHRWSNAHQAIHKLHWRRYYVPAIKAQNFADSNLS